MFFVVSGHLFQKVILQTKFFNFFAGAKKNAIFLVIVKVLKWKKNI